MNRLCLLLLFVMALPLQANAQGIQAQLQKRADQARDPAKADYSSASKKYDSVVLANEVLYVETVLIDARYQQVKNGMKEVEKLQVEIWLKSATSLSKAQDKLLDGPNGVAYKQIISAKKYLDAGETAYSNKQWATATIEYGSCTSIAKSLSRTLDVSVKDLSSSMKTAEALDKILKMYE